MLHIHNNQHYIFGHILRTVSIAIYDATQQKIITTNIDIKIRGWSLWCTAKPIAGLIIRFVCRHIWCVPLAMRIIMQDFQRVLRIGHQRARLICRLNRADGYLCDSEHNELFDIMIGYTPDSDDRILRKSIKQYASDLFIVYEPVVNHVIHRPADTQHGGRDAWYLQYVVDC